MTLKKCFIIIDALDECNERSHRKEILRILNTLKLGATKVFVTSRPHPHDIKQNFQNALRIEIEANEADIRAYCRRIMEENENTNELVQGTLKDEVADIVSNNARGMYATIPLHHPLRLVLPQCLMYLLSRRAIFNLFSLLLLRGKSKTRKSTFP